MGCDIHFVVEYLHPEENRWIGVFSSGLTPAFKTGAEPTGRKKRDPFDWAWPRNVIFDNRDYGFFAELAGVRGNGPEAKGIPDDASELAMMEIDGWGEDGHSHTYYSLKDFVRIWLGVHDKRKLARTIADDELEGNRDSMYQTYVEWVGYAAQRINSYRVVIWFDN